MFDFAFPPSVNWSLPQICDSNGRLLAYGAKNRVVILRVDDGAPGGLKFAFQFEAHRDRVVAVRCYKGPKETDTSEYIVTATDDRQIRVWEIEPATAFLLHSHSAHKSKPTSLSWRPSVDGSFDQSVIVSGDVKGTKPELTAPVYHQLLISKLCFRWHHTFSLEQPVYSLQNFRECQCNMCRVFAIVPEPKFTGCIIPEWCCHYTRHIFWIPGIGSAH